MQHIQFPQGFEWGAATASAQIEGASTSDGKGESVWDRFCRKPGAIMNGDTVDNACDHYNLYKNDVQLMKEMGLQTYRFSIAWPRILPNGTGEVNQAGVSFYRNLLLELKNAGIKPAVTLFHWDLPQALEDQGGWYNRKIAYDFENFAKICFKEFGDLVDRWITLNEPAVVVQLGHESGEHAPGHTDPSRSLQVAHHLLLAHGLAVRAFRSMACKGHIGITLNMAWMYPASNSPEDRLAADVVHTAAARWYADPVFLGAYPKLAADFFRSEGRYPQVESGDFEIIQSRCDFLGINYYMSFACRDISSPDKPHQYDVRFGDGPRTDMDWEINPDGLYKLLKRLSFEYPDVPLYITENGAAFDDPVTEAPGTSFSGGRRVADTRRIQYLQDHFKAASQACSEGVALKGYYVWSLMDNFEWAFGYARRFGLIHVNFSTQERTLKDSAYWFKQVIQANGFDIQ